MLSPDPLVGNPLDGQNWNRYSYVLNNPLKYTDPSGFDGNDSSNGLFNGPINIGISTGGYKYSYNSTCTSDSVGTCSINSTAEHSTFFGSISKWEYSVTCTSEIAGMCHFANAEAPSVGNAQIFAAALGYKIEHDFKFRKAIADWACSKLPNGCTAPVTNPTSPGGTGDGNSTGTITNTEPATPDLRVSSGTNAAQISAGSGGFSLGNMWPISNANAAGTGMEGQVGSTNGQVNTATNNYKLYLIASKHLPAGHVTIAGKTPDGIVKAKGFYPRHDLPRDASIYGSVPGEIRDDIRLYDAAIAGEPGIAMTSLSVTQAQHDAALRFMEGFADRNRYNLYKCSCVHAALESLNAAGVASFNTDITAVLPHAIYEAISLGMQIPAP